MESTRILNGLACQCLTFEGSPDSLPKSKHLICLIPGNPGVIEFYYDFMKELHELLKQRFSKTSIPIVGVSHGGHQVFEERQFQLPDLNEHKPLYELKGQTEAKYEFIKSLPKDTKLILIGHSIGCKMLLDVMKKAIPEGLPIVKTYMLFPTIERMRDTPNGKKLWPLLPHYSKIYFLLLPLMLLPTFIQRFLLTLYLFFRSPPLCVYNAALQLFDRDVNKRVVALAHSELREVEELDVETLTKYGDRISFYFGTTDDWCPLSYVTEMTEKIPELDHTICSKKLEHAFVVQGSKEMAKILAPLIEKNILDSSSD